MIDQRKFTITIVFDGTGRNINTDPPLDPLSLALALSGTVSDLLVHIRDNAQIVEKIADEVTKRPVDLIVPDRGGFRQVGH